MLLCGCVSLVYDVAQGMHCNTKDGKSYLYKEFCISVDWSPKQTLDPKYPPR